MGRGSGAVVAGALLLSACSSETERKDTPPEAPKERSSSEAKPAADLDASIRFAASRMPPKLSREADLRPDARATALALEGERAAFVACGEGAPGEAWVVAHVTPTGKADVVELVRSTGASKNAGPCTTEVVKRIPFPATPHPSAVSVWVALQPKEAPPAPVPTGSAAPATTTVGCASDNVRSFLKICELANVRGDMIGDGFGDGGLGLTGIGEGGPGRGEGIGLGSIGTIGGSGRIGSGGGSHRSKPPSVRMGATKVSGRLPPEVIQRIVRQHFGRFRLCYENSLRSDPTLEGMVTVAFTIDPKGEVSATSHTTTMKDEAVGKCVERVFTGLSFPQPEGGVVQVTYPITFAPGAVSKRRTADAVLGVPLEKLEGPALAQALSKSKPGVFAGSVSGDPASEVPFVVFVDVSGDHYTVLRVPAEAPVSPTIVSKQFGVFVTPAGSAKDSTAFLD